MWHVEGAYRCLVCAKPERANLRLQIHKEFLCESVYNIHTSLTLNKF